MNASDRAIRFVGFRRTVDHEVDAQRLFSGLTEHGERCGCVLLQSSDNIPKYGERSLAVVGASLRIEGRRRDFSISAMDSLGRCLLPLIRGRLSSRVEGLKLTDSTLRGRIDPDLRSVAGRRRPFRQNQMDIIREVAFLAESDGVQPLPTHGLFGGFAYTFVHQYESFDRNSRNVLHESDYLFFMATRMFMIDHARRQTHLVSSVPIVDGPDLAGGLLEAEQEVDEMSRMAESPPPARRGTWVLGDVTSDTNRDTFITNVETLKKEIHGGRAFQVVFGRMLSAPFSGSPYDVYCRLSRLNPSPYMFYIKDEQGALLAASPEMAVRVQPVGDDAPRNPRFDDGDSSFVGGDPDPLSDRGGSAHPMQVEVRPIAGTKPRGILNGCIDPLVDAKYETSLKIDAKELAEHTMLVDLARNDIASVSLPGTTIVDEPFVVEKYSHVQHLVSNVSGILDHNLDALHAYLATMNMGTVTGAPKLEAMKMINELERSSRGFFGGSVGYVTPDGSMDTALTIRAIRIKNGMAFVRVAAGIVAESIEESEWVETEHKSAACLKALRSGRGPALIEEAMWEAKRHGEHSVHR